MSLQVLPSAKNHKDSLRIIDEIIKVIDESGLNYEVGPMETSIDGELGELLDLLKKTQELTIDKGAKAVFSNVKIIHNPTGVMTIKEKVSKFRG